MPTQDCVVPELTKRLIHRSSVKMQPPVRARGQANHKSLKFWVGPHDLHPVPTLMHQTGKALKWSWGREHFISLRKRRAYILYHDFTQLSLLLQLNAISHHLPLSISSLTLSIHKLGLNLDLQPYLISNLANDLLPGLDVVIECLATAKLRMLDHAWLLGGEMTT